MSITFDIAALKIIEIDGQEVACSAQLETEHQVNVSNSNAFLLMDPVCRLGGLPEFDYSGQFSGEELRTACDMLAELCQRARIDHNDYLGDRYSRLSALFDRAFVSNQHISWG